MATELKLAESDWQVKAARLPSPQGKRWPALIKEGPWANFWPDVGQQTRLQHSAHSVVIPSVVLDEIRLEPREEAELKLQL